MRVDLLEYREEYKNLMEEIDDLEQGIEVSLAVDSDLLQVGMEEAMYTMNNTCNPMKFHLNSEVELNPCIFTEPPYSFNEIWIRQVIKIEFNSSNSNGSDTLPVFTAMLEELISSGKAKVLHDEAVMLTNLPVTSTGYGVLSISIFGTHIRGGWKRMISMENYLNWNRQSCFNETYCNPKKFHLDLNSEVERNPCIFTELPYSFNKIWIRKVIKIGFNSSNSNGSDTFPVFTAMLEDLISSRQAKIVNDLQVMLTRLPCTYTGHGELNISIFGVHIQGGRKRMIVMENNVNENAQSFPDGSSHALAKEPEKEKPRTPDDSDANSFCSDIRDSNSDEVEPEEEPSSFNFNSGNLELVDTIILKGDPG